MTRFRAKEPESEPLPMDPIVIVVAVIAVIAVGVAVGAVVLTRRASPELAQIVAQQGELAGRLAQLAEQTTAGHGLIAERLQVQERDLSQSLNERLTDVSRRVSDGLERSMAQTAQTMSDLRERLVVIETAKQSMVELASQVTTLNEVLSNKQARGAFGEVQLENLVENALPPAAYHFQATLSSGRRVDCRIELPQPPGPICIDAKFPLESWHALRAAADEAAHAAALKGFAQAVTTHVRDIAEKYIVPGETAEGALLFLPSEAVYAELHASAPEVVEKANRSRVYIVSPTTLWAVLHTMRAILKDIRMREEAGRIQAEVEHLLNDVRLLDDRVGKLMRHSEQAGDDMRQIRISTEKITKRAEAIREVRLTDESSTEAPDALPGRPPRKGG